MRVMRTFGLMVYVYVYVAGAGLWLTACSNHSGKGHPADGGGDMTSFGGGNHLDAGPLDGSVVDGSVADAASAIDASVADASAIVDASMTDDLGALLDGTVTVIDIDATTVDALIPPDLRMPQSGCTPPPAYTRLSTATAGIPSTDLVLWIRADVGLTLDANGGVCQADDQSGNGHDFVQTTVAARPHVGMLSDQSALSNAAGQYLENLGVLDMSATSPRTFVVVAQLVDVDPRTHVFLQGQPTSDGTFLGIESNTFNQEMTIHHKLGLYCENNAYDSQVATSLSPFIASLRLDSMTMGEPVLSHLSGRINGVDETLTRTNGGLGNGNLESYSSANHTWIGFGETVTIAEVLVWSHALSITETDAVEAYLAARYAITIP